MDPKIILKLVSHCLTNKYRNKKNMYFQDRYLFDSLFAPGTLDIRTARTIGAPFSMLSSDKSKNIQDDCDIHTKNENKI